jgi:hypothetical protein
MMTVEFNRAANAEVSQLTKLDESSKRAEAYIEKMRGFFRAEQLPF